MFFVSLHLERDKKETKLNTKEKIFTPKVKISRHSFTL